MLLLIASYNHVASSWEIVLRLRSYHHPSPLMYGNCNSDKSSSETSESSETERPRIGGHKWRLMRWDIVETWDLRQIFGLQPKTYNLQPTTYNLQPTTFYCLELALIAESHCMYVCEYYLIIYLAPPSPSSFSFSVLARCSPVLPFSRSVFLLCWR